VLQYPNTKVCAIEALISSLVCFLHCNTLHNTATHSRTLQHTAQHCNTLQNTATHCTTLQHTATHCSTLQHTHHMTCVLSALSRGSLALSPFADIIQLLVTRYVSHAPTILYPGTNLSLRKLWPEIPKISRVPKLSQGQICCRVQDCWRMAHITCDKQLYHVVQGGTC